MIVEWLVWLVGCLQPMDDDDRVSTSALKRVKLQLCSYKYKFHPVTPYHDDHYKARAHNDTYIYVPQSKKPGVKVESYWIL
jgi:hypothetical protein